MSIVAFPMPKPRPRVTPEGLALRLLEKVEAGEPGAEKLLRRIMQMNPDLWTRLAEPKGVIVSFPRGGRHD